MKPNKETLILRAARSKTGEFSIIDLSHEINYTQQQITQFLKRNKEFVRVSESKGRHDGTIHSIWKRVGV